MISVPSISNNKPLMKRSILQSIGLFLLSLVTLVACERMPVGYLQVEQGSYSIDSLVAYRHPYPTTPRGMDSNIPWTSFRMEGVAGTKPLQYAFADVKTAEGGDATAFKKVVELGLFTVQGGGILVLQQKALELLPDGKYIISLRISNEGHSVLKTDVYTIIVKDKEEAPVIDDNEDDVTDTPSDDGDRNDNDGTDIDDTDDSDGVLNSDDTNDDDSDTTSNDNHTNHSDDSEGNDAEKEASAHQ